MVYSTAGAVINTLKKERLVVDKELPTVSITSPAAGGTLNQTVTISTQATDVNPSSVPVDRVEFYLDDVLIGTDTTESGS